MNAQNELFPELAGRARRRQERTTVADELVKRDFGMATAAAKGSGELETAREAAKAVARRDGVATSSSTRRYLDDRGVKLTWGNWAGSLFKTGEWEPTGRWVPSTHEGGHGRAVREWRLK